ncbi:MAG: YcjF family protein, partial [Haemophilus parahaemolyticus]|nr:YcjF family protein [Haemophilus parahaemolyticus]
KNMVFAGTTELVAGMLSHNVLRKLFGQAIQGLGVGILTARLGIKAMEFCRPITFKNEEKPNLKVMSKEIYLSLVNSEQKEAIFRREALKSL